MKILFCLFIFLTLKLNAQESGSKLGKEVLEFCNRIDRLYGAVFIDTVYAKADTMELNKNIATSKLKNAGYVVKLLGLKFIDFDFTVISMHLDNIVSLDSFFKIKDVSISYTPYEIVYNDKLDSIFQTINNRTGGRENLPKRIRKIEELLIKSSYWSKGSEEGSRSKSKLLKILSIFESKEYFLFVYTISELYSTLHSYPKYELIIK